MPRTVKFHLVKDFGDYQVPPPVPAKKVILTGIKEPVSYLMNLA